MRAARRPPAMSPPLSRATNARAVPGLRPTSPPRRTAAPAAAARGKNAEAPPPPLALLPPTLPALAAAGATLGPLLDAIHSYAGLQVYDLLPVDLFGGAIRSSYLVPPLLAAFYVSLASLDAAAEALLLGGDRGGGEAPPAGPHARGSGGLLACYASLASGLALSATLHSLQVDPSTIAACLALFAAANWWLFDRTRRGLALAALCAVVAPLAEAQLMARLGAWHYPRADAAAPVLFASAFSSPGVDSAVGFVSWVPLCYFFYAPSVLGLGRRLRAEAAAAAAAGGGGGGGGSGRRRR